MTYTIAAFYKFFSFPDFETRKADLAQLLCGAGVKGTVLLAAEGEHSVA